MIVPRPAHLYRFFARVWGTRHADCPFLLRLVLVWRTTWRHSWSYRALNSSLEAASRGDPVDLETDHAAVPDRLSLG